MRNILLSITVAISLHCLAAPSLASEPAQEALPSLSIHGTDYVNACSPEIQSKLRADLTSFKIGGKEQLWTLIKTLMCAEPNKTNIDLVKASTEAKIWRDIQGTGEAPMRIRVKVDNEFIEDLFAIKKVWGATIAERSSRIDISYSPDDACVKRLTFRQAKKKWVLYETGEACD